VQSSCIYLCTTSLNNVFSMYVHVQMRECAIGSKREQAGYTGDLGAFLGMRVLTTLVLQMATIDRVSTTII
jgi:hypothetical protein